MRSSQEPLGKHDNDAASMEICVKVNTISKNTFKVLYKAHDSRIPVSLENPDTSIFWWTPEFIEWRDTVGAVPIRFDCCRYGMDYKKRTYDIDVGGFARATNPNFDF